jgi:SAM-dependent methyltransferase
MGILPMSGPPPPGSPSDHPPSPINTMPQRPTATPSFTWDIHSLYELCAQNPPRDARLLRAIHADTARVPRFSEPGSSPSKRPRPLTLAEDFCGTAALSRAWCALSPRFAAVGVDIHAPTLARAKQLSAAITNLKLIRADVLKARDKADLIAVLNFSIGELHDRATLVKYLRHARSRLRPRGVLICDLYGGSDAFETGLLDQTVTPPPDHPAKNDRILYSWEQRTADPLTARVVNAMHFDVTPGYPGSPSRASRKSRVSHQIFLDAFVYHWRLWSVPELRDAMLEAGFKATRVYSRMADATDSDGNLYVRPIEDPTDLGDSFNVFVVAS